MSVTVKWWAILVFSGWCRPIARTGSMGFYIDVKRAILTIFSHHHYWYNQYFCVTKYYFTELVVVRFVCDKYQHFHFVRACFTLIKIMVVDNLSTYLRFSNKTYSFLTIVCLRIYRVKLTFATNTISYETPKGDQKQTKLFRLYKL